MLFSTHIGSRSTSGARLRLGRSNRDRNLARRRLSDKHLRIMLESLQSRELLTAQVATDMLAYSPGQTAIITTRNDGSLGTDFNAGEAIHFHIDRTDGIPIDSPPAIQDGEVTDGIGGFDAYQDSIGTWIFPDADGAADGQIGTTGHVDSPFAGASLQLSALGLSSGATATYDFTDSTTTINTVTVGAQSTTLTYGAGSSTGFPVTFDATSSDSGASLITFVASGLPAGATARFSPSSITVGLNVSNTNHSTLMSVVTGTNTFAGAKTITVTTSGATKNRSGTGTVIVNPKAITVAASSSFKIYDGTTEAPSTPAMATVRENQTATLLAKGKVLVIGGYNDGLGDLVTVEVFDPISNP